MKQQQQYSVFIPPLNWSLTFIPYQRSNRGEIFPPKQFFIHFFYSKIQITMIESKLPIIIHHAKVWELSLNTEVIQVGNISLIDLFTVCQSLSYFVLLVDLQIIPTAAATEWKKFSNQEKNILFCFVVSTSFSLYSKESDENPCKQIGPMSVCKKAAPGFCLLKTKFWGNPPAFINPIYSEQKITFYSEARI